MKKKIVNNFFDANELNGYFIKKSKSFVFFLYKTKIENTKQGWKIHISADSKNLIEIIFKIKQVLVNDKISFKILLTKEKTKHSKIAPILMNGKTITIYTVDELEFVSLIKKLYTLLNKYDSFKVIGDRNFKNSIINYRYGNFAPERNFYYSKNGEKIEDSRDWYLHPDAGIKDPFTNENSNPQKIILNKKYLFQDTLHFSNQGGVYKCKNLLNNKHYVLKEYRFSNSNDGENMRVNEIYYAKIKPKYIEQFSINNSIFYVFEYISGSNLLQFSEHTNVFTDKSKYKKINNIMIKLKNTIEWYHNNDYAIRDVLLENFIISNGKLYLIDKETMVRLDSNYSNTKYTDIYNPFFKIKNNDYYKTNLVNKDWIFFFHQIIRMLNISINVYIENSDNNEFLKYLALFFEHYKLDKDILKKLHQIFLNTEKINIKPQIIDNNFWINTFYSSVEKINKLEIKSYDKSGDKQHSNLWNAIFNSIFSYFEENNLYYFNYLKNYKKFVDINNNLLSYEQLICKALICILNKNELKTLDVIEYINLFYVNQVNNEFYIKNKNKLVPYIEHGYASFVLVKIIAFETFKNKFIKIQLIKDYKSLSKFPEFAPKSSWAFGSVGIAYTMFYLSKVLKKGSNSIIQILKKISNLNFLTSETQIYTQEGFLSESFFRGKGMVLYFLNKIAKEIHGETHKKRIRK